MDNEVLVSGVRLTAEQVAWLNDALGDGPPFEGDDSGFVGAILEAVFDALPVGTP